jgi:hypothetical protein
MAQPNQIYIENQLQNYVQKIAEFKAWAELQFSRLALKTKQNPEGLFEPLPMYRDISQYLHVAHQDILKFKSIFEINFGIVDNGYFDKLMTEIEQFLDDPNRQSETGLRLIEKIQPTLEKLQQEQLALMTAMKQHETLFEYDKFQKFLTKRQETQKQAQDLLRIEFTQDPKFNSRMFRELKEFATILNFPTSTLTQRESMKNIIYQIQQRSQQLPENQTQYYYNKLKIIYSQYQNLFNTALQRLGSAFTTATQLYADSPEFQKLQADVDGLRAETDLLTSTYKTAIESLHRAVDNIQTYLDGGDPEDLNRVAHRNLITIRDRPVIQIFELTPPPVVDMRQSTERLQLDVQNKFKLFQWPNISKASQDNECLKTPTLNLAQKLSYHYMHPYNQIDQELGVNVMLVHSAGSGKTCTGQLISSVFARAEYTIIQVSKITLKADLPNTAIKNQCDFNVQQYTRGKDLLEVVIHDKTSQFIKNNPEISFDDAKRYVVATLAKENPKLPSSKTKKDVDSLDEFANILGVEPNTEEENNSEDMSVLKQNPKRFKKIFESAKEYVFKTVLKDMGIVQVTTSTSPDALSYHQFGTLNSNMQNYIQKFLFGRVRVPKNSQGDIGKYLRTHSKAAEKQQTAIQIEREKTGDVLRKCFVIIDEVHKLVTNPPDLDTKHPQVDFQSFRELIWESYQRSGKDSVRVCLLTATPIAEHPMDLVNLVSLLAPRSLVRRLGFHKYFKIDKANKANTEQEFINDHYVNGTLKPQSKEGLKKLFNGRISYFNYSGDPNRFPQPSIEIKQQGYTKKIWSVQYVPVKLSLYQANMMTRCFPETQTPASHVMGVKMAQMTRGFFIYNTETKKLTIDPKVPPLNSSQLVTHLTTQQKKQFKTKCGTNKACQKHKANIVSSILKKRTECLLKNAIWPEVNAKAPSVRKKLGIPEIWNAKDVINCTDIEKLKKYFTDAVLKLHSPIIQRLLRSVEKRSSQAKLELINTYKTVHKNKPYVNFKNRMKSYKQYIFTDNTNDTYGVKLIQKFLETIGYQRVNTGKNTDEITPSATPYKGMMVFDGSVKDSKVIAKLLKYYNGSDNIDGRKCSLFVNSGRFKEGISLQDIRSAHIVGIVMTHADLVQSVARAIRNCSRRRTPHTPGRGWSITIDIYSPSYPGMDSFLHPLEILRSTNKDSDLILKAKQEMAHIMQENAYDKHLLAPINKLSYLNEQSTQLWKTDRIKPPI